MTTTTRERSVTLRPDEVRGIQDGSLTEIRRAIKPQPDDSWMEHLSVDYGDPFRKHGRAFGSPAEMWANYYQTWTRDGQTHRRKRWWVKHPDGFKEIVCPLGEPGTVLVGKEAYRLCLPNIIEFRADGHRVELLDDRRRELMWRGRGWYPSTNMPQWAARLRFENTAVRVEQDAAGMWEWVVSVKRIEGER